MKFSKLFIAIRLPPEYCRALEKLRKALSQELHGIRWAEDEQYHITLKFLGDIENREIPTACEFMARACEVQPGFSVRVSGLGTFPRNKPPRVLWAGITEGQESLAAMHKSLDATFPELGIAPEGRAYSPHLTLGRVSKAADPDAIARILETHADRIDVRFEAHEVLLFESEKVGKRHEYHVLDHVELA